MFFLQFKILQPWQQASLLCRRGVHLADRRDGDYLVALYALADFYVEVHHRYSDSEIVLISSFYDTACLEPYLRNLTLESLFQPSA